MRDIRIIYFTKYTRAGASSRYRSYQYFEGLQNAGNDITAFALFPDRYVEVFYKTGRKPLLTVFRSYLQRIFQLLSLKDHDIVFVEYELFPYLPLWVEKLFLKKFRKLVLDYDDAIFHNYDDSNNPIVRRFLSDKIYKLCGLADLVITGSPYLTKSLEAHAEKIVEIPTSLDLSRYQNVKTSESNTFRIGWIGSKTTSINIQEIIPAIRQLQVSTKLMLVLIGFDTSQVELLKDLPFEVVTWTASGEADTIASFDVGIMPLSDNKFNLGKCGFKLLQYMACGLPTISSPFPANIKINRDNNNLFAVTSEEWLNAFENVLADRQYFKKTGVRNLEIVKEFYSVQANLPEYIRLFNELKN